MLFRSTILRIVKQNYTKVKMNRIDPDPLKLYHSCRRFFQNVSSSLPRQALHRRTVSLRKPRKPSTIGRLVVQLLIYTSSYSDHWARSAHKKIWLDECMVVRPFAGGEWAHDATMAGRAANGQSRKAKKIPLISPP